MYNRVEQTFYVLSSLVMLGILFVASPSQTTEVTDFQNEVMAQVVASAAPLVPQIDPLSDMAFIYDSIDQFYGESATEMIAILDSHSEMPNLDNVAYAFVAAFQPIQLEEKYAYPAAETPEVAATETWTIPKVSDLEDLATSTAAALPKINQEAPSSQGLVAGIDTQVSYYEMNQPVNGPQTPWVTVSDNLTGEKYCLAIYGGEVNKYPGPCKYDYH